MSGNAANVELMLGKMLSYENDWRKNQGQNVPPPPSLTDDERAIARKVFNAEPDPKLKEQRYNRLSKDPRTADLVSPPSAAPDAAMQPVRVNSPEEALKLPSGTSFVTPDGRVKVRP